MSLARIQDYRLVISIKSIARDLGISHMTVSRALSGHPNVNAETRRRIVARAAALGYVKSSAASVMRGAPTAIVGLLLPNIVNEFYARFANALAVLCADLGFDLVINLTNDSAARQADAIRRLRALQARTAIMVPAPGQLAGDRALHEGMRIIHLIRASDSGQTDTLLFDERTAIMSAVVHLLDNGHRRIGYIGGSDNLSSGRERLSAFTAALASRGLRPDGELIRTGDPLFETGSRCIAELIAETKIEAVVCGGFEISRGALEACLNTGVKFPDDLGFIGFGDLGAYRWIGGGITAIDLPADALAERAVAMLNDDQWQNEPQEALPCRLLIRGSTRMRMPH
ncbi:LacI family DNA-binding transcriptional regulator [Devosia algicola]|uniref:LacI family DNA-binding transcriptional regulator n=1 Tax=Devosia algicola TaxID=3026418 RepID=A0ABY7YMB1_9HYPH|nr:LacI family DNA-binding transcriptional regulator [Devosia algicola]WDR02436.1 LacI family DNA-binding transcriptional regulator [Devosia algicola]